MLSAAILLLHLTLAQDGDSATAAKAPVLQRGATIVTNQDYPEDALRRGKAGIVSLRLLVSAEGKVTDCQVTESTTYRPLDTRSCWLVKRRAVFDPSRNARGEAVAGIYRLSIAWGVGGTMPTNLADAELKGKSIPSDYRNPAQVVLIFDDKGRVTECDIKTPSGNAEFDKAACTYGRRVAIKAPNAAGRDIPVVAVRYLTVKLVQSSDAS